MARIDVYPITLEDCAKQWRADQDGFIEMKQRAESSEARAAQLEAEQDELARQLSNRCDECGAKLIDNCQNCGAPQCCPQCCKIDELRAKLEQAQRAMSLADVGSLDELGDWIVGAQSEIASLAGQLREIWDMQSKYMHGELSTDNITVGYLSDETPLGQQIDGQGDEVEP